MMKNLMVLFWIFVICINFTDVSPRHVTDGVNKTGMEALENFRIPKFLSAEEEEEGIANGIIIKKNNDKDRIDVFVKNKRLQPDLANSINNSQNSQLVIGDLGKIARLDCKLHHSTTNVVSWLRLDNNYQVLSYGEMRIVSDKRLSFRYHDNNNHYQLIIENVTQSDEGVYSCQIGPETGTVLSAEDLKSRKYTSELYELKVKADEKIDEIQSRQLFFVTVGPPESETISRDDENSVWVRDGKPIPITTDISYPTPKKINITEDTTIKQYEESSGTTYPGFINTLVALALKYVSLCINYILNNIQ